MNNRAMTPAEKIQQEEFDRKMFEGVKKHCVQEGSVWVRGYVGHAPCFHCGRKAPAVKGWKCPHCGKPQPVERSMSVDDSGGAE